MILECWEVLFFKEWLKEEKKKVENSEFGKGIQTANIMFIEHILRVATVKNE